MSVKFIVFTISICLTILPAAGAASTSLSDDELAQLSGLWLGYLEPLTADPSNRWSDNDQAAKLGQRWFFEPKFSANGKISCATCHPGESGFIDLLARSEGLFTTRRRTMSIIGMAYSPWLFWDGRVDSLWSQALGPLESRVEHGTTRLEVARVVSQFYRSDYQALFAPLPNEEFFQTLSDRASPVSDEKAKANWQALTQVQQQQINQIFVNVGKAIAAYEQKIIPGKSRFDDFIQAYIQQTKPSKEAIFSEQEQLGAKLFVTKGQCIRCHNGPLLTNHTFVNTGIPQAKGLPFDSGRIAGVQKAINNPFNCLGPYSDASPQDCQELTFAKRVGEELVRAYKVPSLRNVAMRAPYMHTGEFTDLRRVIEHYNQAPKVKEGLGHSELNPLQLTEPEKQALIAFLTTLNSAVDAEPHWLQNPNDPQRP